MNDKELQLQKYKSTSGQYFYMQIYKYVSYT